jgi:predicted N-acetyltransferase YhbS
MNDVSLTILPETPDDALAIERLHERTFGPGRYARTAFRIREGAGHRLDLSFTARIGTLLQHALAAAKASGQRLVVLVGDEPYYAKAGFKRIPKGRARLPGPVDPRRLLVAELAEAAFEGVSGPIRPDWDAA